MIVRKRGGDALGLIGAFFFVAAVANYLRAIQQFDPDQPMSWGTWLFIIGPFAVFGGFFLFLFSIYPKNPQKITSIAMGGWIVFCLFSFGNLIFSDLKLSSADFLQYFGFCAIGFFFLYSARLQAIRLSKKP